MNSNSTTEHWIEHYEQQHHHDQAPSSQYSGTTMAISSPSSDSPKRAAGKRSRASKRSIPTTLLNASPSNFRSLVQKFTGRSSTASSAVPRNGPVTLNFASGSSNNQEIVGSNSNGYEYANYHNRYDNHQEMRPQHQLQHHHHHHHEDVRGGYEGYYYNQQTAAATPYQVDQGSAVSMVDDFGGYDDRVFSEESASNNNNHHRHGVRGMDGDDMAMLDGFEMDDIHALLNQ